MSLISVIVPVYKVEPYLNKCIESIVNQTYKNLEIILVDDGSPDNCPAICDSWAEKDSRVKVYHQANRGVSVARNLGIDAACGEYIVFVDSDDWLHEFFIEALYRAMKEGKAELSACDVVFAEDERKSVDIQSDNDFVLYTTEKALETLQYGLVFRAVPWNKMFKKELLNELRFKEDRRHEDEFFTYRALANANRLVYVNQPLYYYRQHSTSYMHSVNISHLDILDALVERMAFFEKNFPSLLKRDKLIVCVSCVQQYTSFLEANKELRKEIKHRIIGVRRKVRFTPMELFSYSFKEIVYIVGSGFCLGLFCEIFKYKMKLNGV